MKSQNTMFNGLVIKYRYDKEHRIECADFPRKKCAFVSMEELTKYYGQNGFDIEPSKYVKPAMEKHVHTWEYLGLAKQTTIDGQNGVIIALV